MFMIMNMKKSVKESGILSDEFVFCSWKEYFLKLKNVVFLSRSKSAKSHILLKKRCFSVTVPVQYMSCWTGLNFFDYVRSYGNPFQQTDNHGIVSKLCARVNSRFAPWGFKKLELKISLYVRIWQNRE